jgi:hypothetical protein
MTGNPSDDPSFLPHIPTKRQLDRIAERLKDPADSLQIVIGGGHGTIWRMSAERS